MFSAQFAKRNKCQLLRRVFLKHERRKVYAFNLNADCIKKSGPQLLFFFLLPGRVAILFLPKAFQVTKEVGIFFIYVEYHHFTLVKWSLLIL